LNKGKKQPKRRPIQKEPESCSEDDEQSHIVPLETDSDSPSEVEAEEQDVTDVEEEAFAVVKYRGKRSTIGFVGMVVGKDEGDWSFTKILHRAHSLSHHSQTYLQWSLSKLLECWGHLSQLKQLFEL